MMSGKDLLNSDRLGSEVLGSEVLGSELLGNVVQISFVSRDYRKTIAQFLRLGIGPWKVQTLHPGTLSETRFRGEPHSYRVITASAQAGNMIWEVVQPVEGTGIFQEFLDARGEGVHHLAFLCPGRSFQEATEEFAKRGFQVLQSGRWLGKVGYAFLGSDDALGVFFEIWDRSPDFRPPEPEAWFPALSAEESGE